MLLSFTVENFKSFSERATLSLLARKSDRTLGGALIGEERGFSGKDRLLPAVAIYGANASGKTNLLLAFAYMRNAVRSSQTSWKGGSGTRFDANSQNKGRTGFFEATFQVRGVTYRYGFRVNDLVFEEEWLYSYPVGRERLLFKRTMISIEENDPSFSGEWELETGPTFSGEKRDHESSFRRTRENSLYLSAAAQDNQADCSIIERWFRSKVVAEIKLNLSTLDQGGTSLLAHKHSNFKSLLLPLLKAADPCIVDIIVRKEPSVDDEDFDQKLRELAKKHKVSFIVASSDTRIEIPFEKQSRGIKRLYALAAGLITALKFGHLCIVDELETSMHPHVASQLLALFQNKSSNPRGSQLIFTTHETRLLNLQHLRRDQVWFCERDSYGLSSLFSLIEFAPRKDENFELGYLRGRYGAVPPAGIDPSWLSAINDEEISLNTEDEDA